MCTEPLPLTCVRHKVSFPAGKEPWEGGSWGLRPYACRRLQMQRLRSCTLGPITQGSGVRWGQEKVQTQNCILQPHILENIEENTSAAVKSP